MTDDLGCSDSRARESIVALLEKAHPWPNWYFVDEATSHLHDCSRCPSDFVGAHGRLIALHQKLERDTRDEIAFLRKSYLAAKHAAAVNDDEHLRSRLLAQLAAAGCRLGEQLWSVNTSGVPWIPFSPLFSDIDDDETAEAMVGAYGFVASLSQEDQQFVVAATAASAVFFRPWAFMEEARLSTINNEEDPYKRDLLLYEWAIQQSPISPASLRCALELGAANIVKEYSRVAHLHAERNRRSQSVPVERMGSPVERAAFDQFASEVLQTLGDFADSMKAGQMDLIHQAQEKSSGSNPEIFLVQALGSELLSNLLAKTRYCLRASEVAYRNPRTGHDEQFSTMMLVQAYEIEFDARIAQPLLKRIVSEGHTDFPQQSEIKLVQGRRPNHRVTAGQVLRLAADNQHVQELLKERGLNPERVTSTGRPVVELRNRVMHHNFKPEDVQLARDLILTRNGAFRALFPVALPTQNNY
jgi:hypothetical protein